MTWFSARNISMSTVPVRSDEIWQLITDPGTLADLTPLVRSIEATGSQWEWALNGVEALGLKVEAVFTVRMEFIDQRQIIFTHDPPVGSRERAGVEGVYDLASNGRKATDLQVDLTLLVDLPLPGLSRHAVEPVLLSTMRATGRRFASNLYEQLGLDPATVSVTEVPQP
jgi:carbon monoxide dehydrogenase subunit G